MKDIPEKIFARIVIVALIPLSFVTHARSQIKTYAPFYDLYDDFKQPVPVPRSVQRFFVQWMKRKDAECGSPKMHATKINLDYDQFPDLLVKSDASCMNGADNDWVWVFRNTGRSYRFVLFDGTHTVRLLRRRSHGLRDIRADIVIGGVEYRTMFRFNGHKYQSAICTDTYGPGGTYASSGKRYRHPCRDWQMAR